MKLNNLNTTREYSNIVNGGNVDISYRDALFLHHAFDELQKNMQLLRSEVAAMTDNEGPNELVNKTGQVLESMYNLLSPIANEIIMPSTDINIFAYVSEEEKGINLKKKDKVQFAETIATH